MPDDFQPKLRGAQIIASTLVSGVVMILAASIAYVNLWNNELGLMRLAPWPIVTVFVIVSLVLIAPFAYIVPSAMTRTALRQMAAGTWRPPTGDDASSRKTDASKLITVRLSTMLVSLALLEGIAILGCLAYVLEAQPLALIAVIVPVLLMLKDFPTQSRFQVWFDRQSEQLAEMRLQGNAANEP